MQGLHRSTHSYQMAATTPGTNTLHSGCHLSAHEAGPPSGHPNTGMEEAHSCLPLLPSTLQPWGSQAALGQQSCSSRSQAVLTAWSGVGDLAHNKGVETR